MGGGGDVMDCGGDCYFWGEGVGCMGSGFGFVYG